MRSFIILLLLLVLATEADTQHRSDIRHSTTQPPDNCEGNSAKLDVVRNKTLDTSGEKITIAIARLGSGEHSRELNQRRLYAVKAYLAAMGVPSKRLVTAEGDSVQGYGRIEIYIDGKLIEILSVERCKDLSVGICDNDKEDNSRYQLPQKSKASHCR